MSRILPLGNIPDSLIYPDNVYRLKINDVKEGQTKEREGSTQKLQFRAFFTVVEPAQYKGMPFSTQFTIGTEADPDADELQTWQTSMGARDFKRFVKSTGLPFGDEEDAEAFFNGVKGLEVIANIVAKTEPDRKKINGVEVDNPYKGRQNNNVTGWYKLGEREPGTGVGATTGTQTRPSANGKAAPSDTVVCSACPPGAPKVARKDLPGHVKEHLEAMRNASTQAGTGDED